MLPASMSSRERSSSGRCFDIGGSILDGCLQTVARRSADATVVEAQGGDARLGQLLGENGEHLEAGHGGIPVLVTAAADEDNSWMRPAHCRAR